MFISAEDINSEFVFRATRSSGPGGQHVNKVNSRITLKWNLLESTGISENMRERLIGKIGSKTNKDGFMIVTCQEFKSQQRNKETAVGKLIFMLNGALVEKKNRKATKPTKASINRRLKEKKRSKDKKNMRRRPDNE